ncbi:amino acid ABC transporter substrate-bindnig protein, partial [Bradyrhizobium sp. Leo170]
MRTFRGGLLIGLAVAALVAAAAIIYERYDTKTLKRTVR